MSDLALQHVPFKQVLLPPLHFILEFAEFAIKSDGHVKSAQVAGRAHLQPASLGLAQNGAYRGSIEGEK